MNSISRIRAQLGVTQSALAEALDVTQGNISHYERGQVVPPAVATRLIEYAARLGHQLRFDDIYGAAPDLLPAHALNPTPTRTAVRNHNATEGKA